MVACAHAGSFSSWPCPLRAARSPIPLGKGPGLRPLARLAALGCVFRAFPCPYPHPARFRRASALLSRFGLDKPLTYRLRLQLREQRTVVFLVHNCPTGPDQGPLSPGAARYASSSSQQGEVRKGISPQHQAHQSGQRQGRPYARRVAGLRLRCKLWAGRIHRAGGSLLTPGGAFLMPQSPGVCA